MMSVLNFLRRDAARLALLPLFVFGAAAFAACGDDDGSTGNVANQTSTPGAVDSHPDGSSLGEELPKVLKQHFQTQFPNEGWVAKVRNIRTENTTLKMQVNEDFASAKQDFDAACTAAAGLVVDADQYHVDQVQVEDSSGKVVTKSTSGRPQCEPVAS